MKRATASSSGFLSPGILSVLTLTLAGVLTFAGSPPRNISQAPTPPLLNNVVSRMNHGSAGPFDIDLPGVECRSGGDAGNYQLVFTFKNNLTVVGSSSLAGNCGSIVSGLIGPNSNQYTVNLTALCNEQFLTVTLQDVQDSQGSSGTASSTIGFLLGDTNGDGAVSASDIAQIKAQSGQPATAASFRADVNASGSITAADVAQTKSGSGTAITTDYVEDFEDGIANGFTLTGLWHVTQNYPNAGSNSLGFVQAETASSIPNGNYNTGSNLTQTIFSGPILITGTNPTLTFRAFIGDEWDQGPEGWDRLSAWISTDGVTVTQVIASSAPTIGGVTIPEWSGPGTEQYYPIAVDLSAYIGQTIHLAFRFETIDPAFNDYPGARIDDIRVTNGTPESANSALSGKTAFSRRP